MPLYFSDFLNDLCRGEEWEKLWKKEENIYGKIKNIYIHLITY
jgi:hypothetical protein